MSHSIIAPSAAHIWGKAGGCTGYVLMAQAYPETEESEESKEGTAAHEIAANMVEAHAVAMMGYPKRDETVGSVASNGIVLTEEMYDAAELYAQDVGEVMRATAVFGGPKLAIERKVHAPRVHELSSGTPDCWLFDERNRVLYVWDFKFGFEVVEAFENWQLINYVAGILDELGIDGLADQYLRVKMRVVQPRAFHRDGSVREWSVRACDLRGHVNILAQNADESLSDRATCRSGSHCKHCPARHACEAARTGGVRLYEAAAAPVPVELSPQALAVQYAIVQRARKQLEYLESGYDEQIKGLLRAGHSIPGYRVEEGVGRERWKTPVEEVIALGDMLGHDLRKRDAITPNQARKLGIDGAVIMAYSEKPRTGLKVVPDNGNKAKQVFSHE